MKKKVSHLCNDLIIPMIKLFFFVCFFNRQTFPLISLHNAMIILKNVVVLKLLFFQL